MAEEGYPVLDSNASLRSKAVTAMEYAGRVFDFRVAGRAVAVHVTVLEECSAMARTTCRSASNARARAISSI